MATSYTEDQARRAYAQAVDDDTPKPPQAGGGGEQREESSEASTGWSDHHR